MSQEFTFLQPLDFWKSVDNLVRNRVFPEKGTTGHSQTRIGLMCAAGGRRPPLNQLLAKTAAVTHTDQMIFTNTTGPKVYPFDQKEP